MKSLMLFLFLFVFTGVSHGETTYVRHGFLTNSGSSAVLKTHKVVFYLKKNVLIENGLALSQAKRMIQSVSPQSQFKMKRSQVKVKFRKSDVIHIERISLKNREKVR